MFKKLVSDLNRSPKKVTYYKVCNSELLGEGVPRMFDDVKCHNALLVNLTKLFRKRKQLLQHECLTPIESGITSSQILQIQNQLD